MIHYIDKLIKQIDVPFATRLDLGNPLQVFFPFWILDSDSWILNSYESYYHRGNRNRIKKNLHMEFRSHEPEFRIKYIFPLHSGFWILTSEFCISKDV
jgi:hypothetical protein